MTTMPSDQDLEVGVREAMSAANADELSLKVIRKQLEQKWQVDLSEKKAFLKEIVTAILREGEEDEDEEEEEEEGEGEEEEEEEGGEQEEEEEELEEEEEAPKAKKRKRADFQLSPALFEFLGSKDEMMNRGDVTKAVWAYIRAESLQDPKDGRKIRNDEKMFRVFKCKTMNMLQIAKKLSPHLKKYSDLVSYGDSDEEPVAPPKSTKTKKAKTENAVKGRPKPAVSKKAVGGKKGGAAARGGGKAAKGDEKKEPKKPRQPSKVMWRVSDELAAIVGSYEATFDDIRSKVNLYIKEHHLQDPSQKTVVICDPPLERVMGQKVVKMFGMQTLISPHRLYKIDAKY